MTHEQALEVLKHNIRYANVDFTQVLAIAIEVIEKRKDEIKLAYDLGYTDCMYDRKRNYEQFDNSLTAPAGDGDEQL